MIGGGFEGGGLRKGIRSTGHWRLYHHTVTGKARPRTRDVESRRDVSDHKPLLICQNFFSFGYSVIPLAPMVSWQILHVLFLPLGGKLWIRLKLTHIDTTICVEPTAFPARGTPAAQRHSQKMSYHSNQGRTAEGSYRIP